jgi:small-conductance mechanosensitive channel
VVNFSDINTLYETIRAWIETHILVRGNLIQLLVILLAFALGYLLARRIKPWLKGILEVQPWAERQYGLFLLSAIELTAPVIILLVLGISFTLAGQNKWPSHLLETTVSLLAAWAVIRQVTSALGRTIWTKLIAVSVMIIAGLNILDLLDAAMAFLDELDITLGRMRLSVLHLIKGLLILAILMRLAQVGSGFLDRRMDKLPDLTPSIQVLLAKLARIVLFTMVALITLSSVGIDLTAFALFGGAVGVGLGFGFQKVFSNLISGILLLLDRSIKPGDVIEVGATFGRIQALRARYAAVRTRDGTEYLIPNEDLITTRVVNWSFSNKLVRLKIPFGVAYDSDIVLVRKLALEAADSTKRVLKVPKAVCHLTNFGESSIDLELRIWINDPAKGVTNIGSDIRLALWQSFKEHGVSFPFPQRDVHLVRGQKKEPEFDPGEGAEGAAT